MADWDRMAPPSTSFRKSRPILYGYLGLGIAATLQGVATAVHFATQPEQLPAWVLWSIGLSCVALVWVGVFFATYAWRRLADERDPITVGPAGLHDRNLSEHPIPWHDISDIRVRSGGRSRRVLTLCLADGARERAGLTLTARIAAVINRRMGYDCWVWLAGTSGTLDRLIAAIEPYAKVHQ